MKRWTMLTVLFLSVAVMQGCAQSAPQSLGPAKETQARGFWDDPSTGLTWVSKDSGKDMSYRGAVSYCRNLRLAGYADWRLASMGEMQGIYDKKADAPGLAGSHGDVKTMWHVRGNLFLTGYQWANNQSGRTSGYQDFFDFNDGRSNKQPSGFLYSSSFMRALCVRGSGDPLAGQRQHP